MSDRLRAAAVLPSALVPEVEFFFDGGPWDGQSIKTTIDGELPPVITWASPAIVPAPSDAFKQAIVYRKSSDNIGTGTDLEMRTGLQAEYVYLGDTGASSP
jgi:hypothetical protein